jgi:hypothetical protein
LYLIPPHRLVIVCLFGGERLRSSTAFLIGCHLTWDGSRAAILQKD